MTLVQKYRDVGFVWASTTACYARGLRGIEWLGLVIVLCSAILWALARIQLGDEFRKDGIPDKLCKTGLYKYMNHPIYIFGGLSYLGLVIAFGRYALITYPIIAILYIGLWVRATRERAIISAKFGR